MKLNRMTLVVALGVGIFTAGVADAAKSPNPMLTDSRVRQVMFDPNQVYELVGTYGYQTSVEFAPDELVKVVTLGDSIAWQSVPYQNRIFIKPVEPDAVTNMTVITDKRTYYFKLNSAKTSGASLTFNVKFMYPSSQNGIVTAQAASPTAEAPAAQESCTRVDPSAVNFNYSTAGDKQGGIALKRAFDDGQFTCLLFAKNSEVPNVYLVGNNGTESLVNTRREGDYLVIERTGALFTLRSGDSHLCLLNNERLARKGRMPANSAEAG